MASCPITSWQIDGETMEMVTDFIFLGSKITVEGDCSQEIKRRLLFGRKTVTNLESMLKSRDITWLTKKGPLVKTMVWCNSAAWLLRSLDPLCILVYSGGSALIHILFPYLFSSHLYKIGTRHCSSYKSTTMNKTVSALREPIFWWEEK